MSLFYDEKLVRNFIKEIKIFPDKLTITVISLMKPRLTRY